VSGIGEKAKVSSSTGFHSKQFIGRVGTAVGSIHLNGRRAWVLRFSTNLIENEEGLFSDDELVWSI
tara:strand:+ start:523 stop:720 length:198 start_codon:yes stop_codon:yes gene_type:complete